MRVEPDVSWETRAMGMGIGLVCLALGFGAGMLTTSPVVASAERGMRNADGTGVAESSGVGVPARPPVNAGWLEPLASFASVVEVYELRSANGAPGSGRYTFCVKREPGDWYLGNELVIRLTLDSWRATLTQYDGVAIEVPELAKVVAGRLGLK